MQDIFLRSQTGEQQVQWQLKGCVIKLESRLGNRYTSPFVCIHSYIVCTYVLYYTQHGMNLNEEFLLYTVAMS